MLITHGGGKAKRFEWICQTDYLIITNENGRREEYSLIEILDILNWLTEKFGDGWFPLANNVERLGHDAEVDGLGVAILRQRPRDVSHAQGASYLGVVLEYIGILQWNNRQKGIKWRMLSPPRDLNEVRNALNAKTAGNEMMTTEDNAAKLAEFIRKLSDLSIVTEFDGNYHHLGATIADAVLQANMKYETHVRPRIGRIRTMFPVAATLSGLKKTLMEETTSGFLDWGGMDRVKRFDDIVGLFSSESIETEDELRGWLLNERNLEKLKKIKGIGPKTIDYFKILTGIDTCAIDRRLLDFLKQAGVEASGYDEAKRLINSTADIMGVRRTYLDHSIWRYIGSQGLQPCGSRSFEAEDVAIKQPIADPSDNRKEGPEMQRDIVIVWSDEKRKAYVSTNKQFRGKTKEEIRDIWHNPHAHGNNPNREKVCEIVDARDFNMEIRRNQGAADSIELKQAKKRVSDDFRQRGYIVLNSNRI